MTDMVLAHQALHFSNLIIRVNKVGKRGHDGSDVRNLFVFLHIKGSLGCQNGKQLARLWILNLIDMLCHSPFFISRCSAGARTDRQRIAPAWLSLLPGWFPTENPECLEPPARKL